MVGGPAAVLERTERSGGPSEDEGPSRGSFSVGGGRRAAVN